jgi:hypothetical protein
MSFNYDYTVRDGETFTNAQITITSDQTGAVTPTDLLTLWRDEPDTLALLNSPDSGLTAISLGEIQSLTITKKA